MKGVCRGADSSPARARIQRTDSRPSFEISPNKCRQENRTRGNQMMSIDPLTASAVLVATAATDAVYVLFTSAVVARRRVPAASWSSIWYLLSSYAVISYTENWVYVA